MKGLEQVCKTKPYQHQLKALQYGHNHKLYAYFMEMGTGKTKVAIDNANYLYDIEEINDTDLQDVVQNVMSKAGIKPKPSKKDKDSESDYMMYG